VFTPTSFLDLVDQAGRLGLFPFMLELFHPTEAWGYEFYALLRRADAADEAAIAQSIGQARAVLATWAPEQDYAAAHAPQEVAALREALQVMRSSTSWKLTAPLRRVVEKFKKEVLF
jgi:hypothetical protein